MPPPTSQDLALACLHRALDEEAFEHPWNVNILFQVTHLRPFSQKWLHIWFPRCVQIVTKVGVTPLVLSWCHAFTYAYLYFAPTLFVRPGRS